MINMKELTLEEIQSNKEMIAQYEHEIELLEKGTSIAAGMPYHERRSAIDELRRCIRSRKEANKELEKRLEEEVFS